MYSWKYNVAVAATQFRSRRLHKLTTWFIEEALSSRLPAKSSHNHMFQVEAYYTVGSHREKSFSALMPQHAEAVRYCILLKAMSSVRLFEKVSRGAYSAYKDPWKYAILVM